MKKIIFLLLCTVSIYGQTLQNPTYGIVTEKNNATDSTPAYFVTQEVDGVHKKTAAALIAFKSDLPVSYAVIVYVNDISPLTATIFDDENPPTTNDNAFKADVDNLYIGTDASTWVYNGSTYVTKTTPASSNFFVKGFPNLDAGNNKDVNIERTGGIKTSQTIEAANVYAGGVLANSIVSNNETPNTIVSFDSSKQIKSLPTDTYPSLTELSYVKGVTSGIQTQINSKQNMLTNPITGTGSQKDPNAYALQDGTILYHSTKWFIPTGTVSTTGTTVTSVGTQFTSAMVGAKLTVNGEWRIITGYTSSTVVTVASAYSINYSGVVAGNWGVFSKSYASIDSSSRNVNYGTDGTKTVSTDGNNNYNVNSEYALFNKLNTNMINLSNNLNLADSSKIIFAAPSENIEVGAKDLGIRRNTAGVLEIYDGTMATGLDTNRRDLLVRNLTISGIPTAPTATAGTNTTQIATTAFVKENTDTTVHWTKTGNDITNNNTGLVKVGGTVTGGVSGMYYGLSSVGNIVTQGQFATNSGYGLSDQSSGMFQSNGIVFTSYLGTIKFNPIHTSETSAGTYDFVGFQNQTIAPTSGSMISNMFNLSPTINQTGGANGITRGIYINPTLTSAADFRAIEVTAGKTLLNNVTLKAGGTASGTAGLKLTSQPAGLATVEQGAVELIGNSLQFTQLAKRRGVVMSQNTIISTTTLGNTTTESGALITSQHGAGYFEVGKMEEITLIGVVQQNVSGGGILSVRVKYAGTTLLTSTTATSTIAAGTPFEVKVYTTCRSTGASGTMQINFRMYIDGVANIPDARVLATIDTTTAQNTTITAQWSVANATNILTIDQGNVVCIEPNK